MKNLLFIFFLIVFFMPIRAYADVSLLVHEATGYSGEMTGAGHITIYVSDVCTDPPLVVRKCREGEQKGVVLSTYPSFIGKPSDEREWYAMPFMAYMYGVDTEKEIPLYANGEIRTLLRETNRAKYLSKLIPPPNSENPSTGRWGGVVGATMNRDIYAFTVKTTPAQDEQFLTRYPLAPKGNNFNVAFNNCADFTKNVMNFYFPGSVSRDFINDFGMTTPKALARSLTGYADGKPELLFHVTKYSQMDGTILRSFGNRSFTETAFTSRKYYITQLLTMPTLLPMFASAYFLTGRFSADDAYQKNSSPLIAKLNLEKARNKKDKTVLAEIKKQQKAERERIFGEVRDWQAYRLAFYPLLEKALKDRLFADKNEVKTFFGDLELQSEPFYDSRGEVMLKVNNYERTSNLGITETNILSRDSDVRLGYKLMLVKIKNEIEAPAKDRVSLETLQKNWEILTALSWRLAELPPIDLPANARFQTIPRKTTTSKKMMELFRQITH